MPQPVIRYEIDPYVAQEYDTAKARFLAKGHILAINECGNEVLCLTDQEKLEACGIKGCTVLQYMSDTYDAAAPGDDQLGGRHIGVATPAGRFSVIFMRRDYPAHLPQAFVDAARVCLLYHELGHADDFRRGINFQHSLKRCRLEQAEVYADDFAKRHLRHVRCFRTANGKHEKVSLWDWYAAVRYRGNYMT